MKQRPHQISLLISWLGEIHLQVYRVRHDDLLANTIQAPVEYTIIAEYLWLFYGTERLFRKIPILRNGSIFHFCFNTDHLEGSPTRSADPYILSGFSQNSIYKGTERHACLIAYNSYDIRSSIC